MLKKIAATLLATAALLASDPPREQKLQQAIDLMESKGDLAHAMPLFEDVARSTDRALAARALLYLAQAQERQGADRARATYERIIKEFGNQTDAVAEARRRLNSLSASRPANALTARLLWVDEHFDRGGSVSSDGRFMAMTDWVSGDLAIRDLSTGQVRRLMAKVGGWESKANEFADASRFSPDQKQIAYAWYTNDEIGGVGQLRVIPAEPGAKPKVVVRNPEYRNIYPAGWTRDGKSLLVRIQKLDRGIFTNDGRGFQSTYQIGWASVADGTVKVLKSLEWWRNVGDASLSPDERYIAYSARAREDSPQTYIYVLAADGSSETILTKTPAVNDSPTWTADGSRILFVSDRSGTFGIWAVAMQDGKVNGAPMLIKENTGKIWPVGHTRAGAYYYGAARDPDAIFGVDLEPATAKVRGPAVRLTEKPGLNPSWSPDRRFVAFYRRTASGADTYQLVVESLETGEERTYSQVALRTDSHAGLRAMPPRWLHDSSGLLAILLHDDMSRSFARLDFKTGVIQEVSERSIAISGVAALSPDDKTLYFNSRDPKGPGNVWDRIIAMDLSSGLQTNVWINPLAHSDPRRFEFGFALSPDGKSIAIITAVRTEDLTEAVGHLSVLGLQSGDAHEIYSFNPSYPVVDKLAWTKDGRSIIFPRVESTSDSLGKTQLMRIATTGGDPEFTGFEIKGSNQAALPNFSLNADNTRIAYTTRTGNATEVWVLENLSSTWRVAR